MKAKVWAMSTEVSEDILPCPLLQGSPNHTERKSNHKRLSKTMHRGNRIQEQRLVTKTNVFRTPAPSHCHWFSLTHKAFPTGPNGLTHHHHPYPLFPPIPTISFSSWGPAAVLLQGAPFLQHHYGFNWSLSSEPHLPGAETMETEPRACPPDL